MVPKPTLQLRSSPTDPKHMMSSKRILIQAHEDSTGKIKLWMLLHCQRRNAQKKLHEVKLFVLAFLDSIRSSPCGGPRGLELLFAPQRADAQVSGQLAKFSQKKIERNSFLTFSFLRISSHSTERLCQNLDRSALSSALSWHRLKQSHETVASHFCLPVPGF